MILTRTGLKLALSGALAAGALFGMASATAGTSWSIGVSVPGVVVSSEPAPVYYEPAPAYSPPPPPVYYQPAPPVRYQQPAYVAPAPVYYEPGPSWEERRAERREWRRREWERREHYRRYGDDRY